MLNRVRSVASFGGVAWLLCIACLVAFGCRGASPFLAAQFATNIGPFVGAVGGGSSQPSTSSGPSSDSNIPVSSVCDLQANLRNIQVSIINEAQQQVRFSMTFLVSAGPGGFVSCSDEITRYEQAGYHDACTPGTCSTISVGCDTITLSSGTRLLRLDFGVNQGVVATLPAAPNTGTSFPQRQLTLGNGSSNIPVPEVIVFGNDDPDFICLGGDLTTQRGFVYSTPPPAALPIGKAVEAIRIQGTVANKQFGTAPEWRLDKTPNNGTIASFQFAAGGTIVATVLDRATDALTNTRNQAVWRVTDAGGTTVIFEER
ncbi:MAG: hypothetical protein HZA51_05590 [Planctomycetes bacterium]|nr:hypothetical protein [Planctomycetota bacterium]